jgi:hypothetical protein
MVGGRKESHLRSWLVLLRGGGEAARAESAGKTVPVCALQHPPAAAAGSHHKVIAR